MARSRHPRLQLGTVLRKRGAPSLIDDEVSLLRLSLSEGFLCLVLGGRNEGGGRPVNVLKEFWHVVLLELVLCKLHASYTIFAMPIIVSASFGMVR